MPLISAGSLRRAANEKRLQDKKFKSKLLQKRTPVCCRRAPSRPLGPVFSTQLHHLAREALVERFRAEVADTGVLLFAGGRDPMRHDTDHEARGHVGSC
eukprot:Skav202326  [mRNA]  locus=scaffold60:357271:360486:+ [translate_table: standard]